MNLRKLTATVATCALLGFASAAVLANPITAAVEFGSSSTLVDSRAYTLGYQFTLSTSVNVNALGYWNDGQSNNHQVGLWTSAGTLLASTTVLSTDQLVGNFLYDDITTLTLGPGSYVIAGEFLGDGDPFPHLAQGVTRISGLTWDHDLQLSGGGLNFPTLATGGAYGDNGILLVTFSVGDANGVPEPISLALVGIGLAGIAMCRRKVA